MHKKQSGFTLLEIMIVVALIAILAVVAIPSFMSTSAKVRAESEIGPFLAEISTKQEVFNTTKGVYFSSSDWFPTPPANVNGTKQNAAVPTSWAALKLQPPESKAACTYFVQSGTGGVVASTALTNCGLTYTPPPINWYFALAVCNMDNDTVTSCYLQSSDDSTIRKVRSGE
jgi:prepilin-type N-terminal cleavage/methylation domain-containing protein